VFSKRFAYLMADGLAPLAAWLDVHGAEVARRLHGGAPQTLIHGDFRFDNIFFEDGSQDPIVMIDWQLVGRGAAAYDVAYLLGGALPAEAERLTVERLLREYHAALVEHGVKDYDYASFVLDYERGLLTILMTIASTDNMEMGEGRGADLIRLWVERLVARARDVDLDGLL
jgi:thiamine kinase-like enzyme